jgi:hypothetical protein
MFKKLILPFAAVAMLASCSDDNDIFDKSAADRLDDAMASYTEALTADGGLWEMEYFTNSDEPGYVMLFEFGTNGAVEISANHKWIGGTFQQQKSLWEVISDDGVVLTFNSYNDLFHIFSTPENITGDYAPTNSSSGSDINEQGYGHEGDYEFQLMEMTSQEIRMVGKKHGYVTYLRRLPEGTDAEAYLQTISSLPARYNSSKFNTLVLTEASGATYTMTSLASGIPSIYARDFGGYEGDAVAGTTSANGIFTLTGFRFADPLTIKRADGTEWELSELTWAEDGTLENKDLGVTIKAPTPAENIGGRSDLKWNVDLTSFTGKFATAYDAANAAIKTSLGGKNTFSAVRFEFAAVQGVITAQMVTSCGSKICRDYITWSDKIGYDMSIAYTGANSTAEKYNEQIPEYYAFKQLMQGTTYVLSNNDPNDPSSITFTDAQDSQSSFVINVN